MYISKKNLNTPVYICIYIYIYISSYLNYYICYPMYDRSMKCDTVTVVLRNNLIYGFRHCILNSGRMWVSHRSRVQRGAGLKFRRLLDEPGVCTRYGSTEYHVMAGWVWGANLRDNTRRYAKLRETMRDCARLCEITRD